MFQTQPLALFLLHSLAMPPRKKNDSKKDKAAEKTAPVSAPKPKPLRGKAAKKAEEEAQQQGNDSSLISITYSVLVYSNSGGQ